ncbi:MAG: hypothetical protein IKZ05_00800 [Clostridia bacterium]|nr:hypothetical protein [Clostridia bacterium]
MTRIFENEVLRAISDRHFGALEMSVDHKNRAEAVETYCEAMFLRSAAVYAISNRHFDALEMSVDHKNRAEAVETYREAMFLRSAAVYAISDRHFGEDKRMRIRKFKSKL